MCILYLNMWYDVGILLYNGDLMSYNKSYKNLCPYQNDLCADNCIFDISKPIRDDIILFASCPLTMKTLINKDICFSDIEKIYDYLKNISK